MARRSISASSPTMSIDVEDGMTMSSPREMLIEAKESGKKRRSVYGNSVNRFRIAKSTSSTSSSSSSSRHTKDCQPPPSSSSSSCERCRRQKKKCSRTQPQCEHCFRSSVECHYPELSAVAKLEEKVEQLTKLVEAAGGPSDPIRHNEPSIVPAITVSRTLDDRGNPTAVAGSSTCHPTMTTSCHDNITTGQGYEQGTEQGADVVQPSPCRNVPADAACNRFVDAYFRHVHHVYPFIDKASVMDRLGSIDDDLSKCERDPDSKKLYLIMAIGCTTLERAGQVPRETCTRFRISYADIIDKCLASRSTQSVEVLFLLSLYSLFDPAGMSPWSLVGILTRQAMAVGITRRLPPQGAEGSVSASASPYQVELKNRLYWSVFVLDRMLSTCLGMPFGLSDPNSDVALPSITMEEMSSTGTSPAAVAGFKSSLQICRHVIQLRQLEESILTSVHLVPNPSLSPDQAQAVKESLRRRIDDWYSQGCLLSATDSDRHKLSFHNTATWLTSRYHSLLILLYHSPSFSSTSSHDGQLQGWLHHYLQQTKALHGHRQLPLNWVTLYRFLSIFSILLLNSHSHKPAAKRDDVMVCAETLEAFPATWAVAHRGAGLFRQFAALLLVEGEGSGDQSGRGGVLGPELRRKWLTEIRSGVRELMQENLGRNSVFCFSSSSSPQQQQQQRQGKNVVTANGTPWMPIEAAQQIMPRVNSSGEMETMPTASLGTEEQDMVASMTNDSSATGSWENDLTQQAWEFNMQYF